jgi:predicted amidohydrolase YtcJ
MTKQYEIPLLHDSHNHVGFYAALSSCLDVRNIKNYNKVIELLQKLPNKINLVMGWTFLKYNMKDIEALPPVLICDQMLHSYIINEKAKKLLVDKYPDVVNNIENPEWVEKNLSSILTLIPGIQGINEEDIELFFGKLEDNGVYIVDDMLAIDNEYISLIKNSKYTDRCRLWVDPNTYRKLSDKNKKKIEGIKIFLDGGLGPETAATDGYISGKKGLLIYSDSELSKVLHFIQNEKTPTAIHSVGELGIAQLLNILEKEKINIPYIRIEHAMFITKEIALKCKKFGITLSMQPNFSLDSLLFKGKLTNKHLATNNPFRMLIDEVGFEPGNDLIFSSDGMPYGIKTALETSLFPPFESQKLTIDEVVKGYCLKEMSRGKIEFEISDKNISNLNVHIYR